MLRHSIYPHQRNVWIEAGATILPGVVAGENSIVAAVYKDCPADGVVGGYNF